MTTYKDLPTAIPRRSLLLILFFLIRNQTMEVVITTAQMMESVYSPVMGTAVITGGIRTETTLGMTVL
jgi:hypothetical protein